MLPCTTNELAEVWLRSAISSVFSAPSVDAPEFADWLTSRRRKAGLVVTAPSRSRLRMAFSGRWRGVVSERSIGEGLSAP